MFITSRTDYYVTLTCVVLLVLFSSLLYLDFNRRVQAGGEQIGTLRQRVNKAQRKYTNQVVWEGLDNEVPVYNNDSIRTGDYSSAVIELRDGTQIDLSENSMIVLNISEEAMDIDFAYGSIAAKRGESSDGGAADDEAPAELNIRSDDKVITIEDSDVSLAQGAEGEALDVTVSRGEANISNESGETQTVGKDERARLTEESIEVKKITLRPLGPANGGRVYVTGRGKAQVNFTWSVGQNGSAGPASVTFEVSRKRDFSEITNRQTVRGNAAGANLGEGTYYWRLSATNNVGQTDRSTVRTITVLKNSPLNLQSPTQGARFEYVTTKPLVNFSWSENELARGYVLEIAGDRGFRNVIQQRRTQVRNTSLGLDAGTYFWRVRTQTTTGGSQTVSPTGTFQIVQNEKTPPPAPLSPVRDREIPAVFFEKEGVVFSWKRNADVQATTLQIAGDSGFSNVIVSRDSGGNFTNVRQPLQPGTYYWRLRGTDRDGRATDFSKALRFQVGSVGRLNLVGPVNGVNADLEGVRQNGLAFQWSAAGFPGTYQLMISKNADFSGALTVDQRVTGLSSLIRLQETGDWFWKVRVLSKNSEVLTESEARSFSIADALNQPTPIYPAANATIDITNVNALTFRWRSSGGVYYNLRVADNRGKTIFTSRSNTTSLTMNDLRSLGDGRFNWTVTACRDESRCAPPMSASFAVTAGKVAPPTITSDDTLYVIQE
ncbi:MAG: FecR domain-containing protein [bacterium]|nr:FecR domain-containing protein [bacterium]